VGIGNSGDTPIDEPIGEEAALQQSLIIQDGSETNAIFLKEEPPSYSSMFDPPTYSEAVEASIPHMDSIEEEKSSDPQIGTSSQCQ